ncbi:unnamed protein product [Brassicogethes aeneus]|uniref:HTH psq-type domain-containing protein n=1 Tax=Brassicogethes aeneus TaxID=1431903 RepID=A0A9P0BN27_BRAAE|nr:unnamed protein product [Brassicogethes aeneus]
MPSKYKRRLGSRKYRDFSGETLQEALEDIQINNLTYRAAADKYGIPKSTLERKLNKKNMKSPGGSIWIDIYRCSYLKENTKMRNAYLFPIILDEGDIEPHEFVAKLPLPQRLRRGGMVFKESAMNQFINNY